MLHDFFSLIYPPACEACSAKLLHGEHYLCSECWYSLPKTGFWKEQENPLTRLFWGRIRIESGTALFFYDKGGKVQKIIHRLKYKGGKGLGFFLGQQLGLLMSSSGLYEPMDFLVPVPLHRSKLRQRGFNQSEVIGQGVSSVTGIPVHTNILQKKDPTQSQTRKKRFSRWENVESVFCVNEGIALQDKKIILLDDVITTGSTLESCGLKILEKGGKIWIATIGVTV